MWRQPSTGRGERLQKKSNFANTLIQPPEVQGNKCLLFKLPSLGHFAIQPELTNTFMCTIISDCRERKIKTLNQVLAWFMLQGKSHLLANSCAYIIAVQAKLTRSLVSSLATKWCKWRNLPWHFVWFRHQGHPFGRECWFVDSGRKHMNMGLILNIKGNQQCQRKGFGLRMGERTRLIQLENLHNDRKM